MTGFFDRNQDSRPHRRDSAASRPSGLKSALSRLGSLTRPFGGTTTEPSRSSLLMAEAARDSMATSQATPTAGGAARSRGAAPRQVLVLTSQGQRFSSVHSEHMHITSSAANALHLLEVGRYSSIFVDAGAIHAPQPPAQPQPAAIHTQLVGKPVAAATHASDGRTFAALIRRAGIKEPIFLMADDPAMAAPPGDATALVKRHPSAVMAALEGRDPVIGSLHGASAQDAKTTHAGSIGVPVSPAGAAPAAQPPQQALPARRPGVRMCTAADVRAIKAELARHLGPISSVMVDRCLLSLVQLLSTEPLPIAVSPGVEIDPGKVALQALVAKIQSHLRLQVAKDALATLSLDLAGR